MLKDSYELYENVYSVYAQTELPSVTEEEKAEIVTNAIKLHNKARLISKNDKLEIKMILKISAAFQIYTFADRNSSKTNTIAVNLLSRSAQEIVALYANASEWSSSVSTIALRSFTAVTDIWQRVNKNAVDKKLPAVDLQDLKISVYQVVHFFEIVKSK